MLSVSQINILQSKDIFKYLSTNNPELYDKWKVIADFYEKTLNRGPYFSDIAFTPHDFENHCMDIYEILNDLIKKENLSKVINAEEMFVLLVAVVLHDIIMAYNPKERETHSKEAEKYVLNQVYDKNNTILKNCLTKNQAKAVGYVILGHSDLKGEFNIDTLKDIPVKGNQPTGLYGEINVRTLSALLRLADELDITNKRIQGIDIEIYKINDSSMMHWQQCNLFQAVRPYKNYTTVILLEIDEVAYETSGDNSHDIKCIVNVKNKIQGELNNVNRILNTPGYYEGWTLSKVEISAQSEILESIKKYESTDPLEDDEVIDEKKKF